VPSQRCKLVQRLPSECQPERADLSGAGMLQADPSGVDLSGANLQAADLSRAELSGVKVENARLGGALGFLRNWPDLQQRGAI